MSSPKKSLDEWVETLSRAELPVLGRTVSQLASVNDYLSSHSAELVRVILHDPNMTAKVLRLSNSVLYNQGRKPINTVSRAIIVLGYEAIRSICLATFVLEKVASGAKQEQLLRELARSFHAAVQAKSLTELRGDADSEEIFIASLLFHLGEMAFWCFGGEQADALSERLAAGMPDNEAQTEILGFRFPTLTLGLTREWKISPTLQEALQARDTPQSRSRSIRLSHQLARAIEQGWNSVAVADAIHAISQYTGVEIRQVRQAAYNNALVAKDTLKEFALPNAENLVPTPPGAGHLSGSQTVESPILPPEPTLAPNPALQLSILRELTNMVSSNVDFNLVLQHVLEGMHRGVGLERALFAIANPSRTSLAGKYAVQLQQSDLVTRFKLSLTDASFQPLQNAFEHKETLWAKTSGKLDCLKRLLGVGDCFIAPLMIHNRLIGAFYGDCAFSQRALGAEDYEAFQLFVAQASLCLQMLSTRKG